MAMGSGSTKQARNMLTTAVRPEQHTIIESLAVEKTKPAII